MVKKTPSFSIKNWSEDDQPREKLRDKGKNTLSDAELIAILIGSGNRNESAVDLSKRILASVNHNLNALGKLTIAQLMQFKGIGGAKAISIVAAMELGRRRRLAEISAPKKINGSQSVFELMQPVIGELPHEEFWIIYLNNAFNIIQKQQASKGGITATVVDIRLIMKTALELGAVALVLCHNHPSGNTQPSLEDKRLTKKITQAAKSLDIKILDHIIITEKHYYSFEEEGLI